MNPSFSTKRTSRGYLRLFRRCTLPVALLAVAHFPTAHANPDTQAPTQSLELREHFGANYPEQIVEFGLQEAGRPGTGFVLDENDRPVPFQLLEQGQKLALRTDLKANATRTWRWFSTGQKPLPSAPGVQITQVSDGTVIGNEFIAVLLPTAESIKRHATSPRQSGLRSFVDLFNHGPSDPRVLTLAPIQGFRLRDGTWTALGPNALTVQARQLIDAKVELLESGPLKAVARIRYDFDKPAYIYGPTKISDPGPGSLTVTMTLLAGQPSVLFEEETDLDEVWAANFYEGLQPDQAQYNGHHATNPKYGHTAMGEVFTTDHRKHVRGEPDAIVDLQYRRPQLPSYISTNQSWRFMAVWDPWVFDSGWYWQLYNAAGSPQSNLVSIFTGPASRALEPALSGASIFTLPADPRQTGRPVAGISSQSYRRSPDATICLHSRFSWGLFSGIKGQDLGTLGRVPTVNLQSNLFGSAVNLTKLAAMQMDYPDPAHGYGGLYMEKAALLDVIQRVRQSRGNKSYLDWLYNAEPSSRPLFDAWSDESGTKMQAAADDIIHLARDLTDDMVNGQGIRTFRFGYWHGGLEMMRRGLWIDQVLASNDLSADQRARVKAAACLFGYVLWDNDFVPMDNYKGFNLGTANMPQQQQGYRDFYALLLANHPAFTKRAAGVHDNVMAQVQQQINESGAHFGCPHYISAAFAPTLNTLMQVKQLGQTDPFRAEPRLTKFAEFYLNLLTPPEIRFPGKPRCCVAYGDSSTEPSPLYGQLGTAFRDANPELSQQLMGAWQASGKPHSGFFGTTVMTINDRLPAQERALGSTTFPGYFTVLRSGWGTPNETAVWIANGDFYRDHRHNDAGELVIYALGVPLCVHWGSIYSPQAAGAYYHSSILPESTIGRPWDRPDPPTDTAGGVFWHHSTEEGFSTGAKIDTSVSSFSGQGVHWTRTLALDHSDMEMPVITIRDDFDGPDAREAKVLTLNLMAQGTIQTSAGAVVPELRTHPAAGKASNPNQLASAGTIFPLNAGVSQLSFTGQHGVDFDVFVVAREPEQAFIGNWADAWTQQSMPKWEERQDILRIRGAGSFRLVLVPFRSGHRPPDLKVELAGDRLTLTANGRLHQL